MEEPFNKTSDRHGLIDQTVDMGNPHMFSALHGLIAKKFRHDDPSVSCGVFGGKGMLALLMEVRD